MLTEARDGDEAFDAGVDFAIERLALVLGLDVNDFSWDAATEEYDGDVRAVIGNALNARFGDEWHDISKPTQ